MLQAGGHWRNWVGNQSCIVRHRGAPESEAALAEMVREATSAGLNVRCAGSGHSFTPVALTSGLHLTLSGMQGVANIDQARKRVSVSAGTTINQLGKALKSNGLSLINQGDIDSQALAGALTTGTHGTGAALGNMASQIVGMRLVQPDGSILVVDETTPDLLEAARVSVGMLGVISEITLQVMDSYNLHEKLWRCDFDECMEQHDELAAKHRHFGFFWCPVPESRHCYCLPDTSSVSTTEKTADVCEMKVIDITDRPPMKAAFERIAYSSEIYPIEYVPNFHELEYAVPVANGKEAVNAVRKLMLEKHPTCIYPIEYRFTAGDSGWISPFYEQDSITLSVSGEPGTDYWEYLKDVDMILRQYGSRPHWGKLHFLGAEDVTALYPRSGDFRALRAKVDPEGRFLNDHLRQLFA
ncbi:FAD-dependent oxidoreductase [Sinorhizobium fredii USDA 205]|uniref:FAD-binding protein n=1 Tax=Rhizobium fredii TaxID=380 RepID=A0A844AH91_RHIFR|nr:D-arabinono-1,4-lactone oxidase [Sinorhizobium fredii]AWM23303.1 FAD/FMN-containing dehydrogenase [Sinorhizobium fredii CCBAU 25509]KSV92497.1 FAD-dependent oxidoreductase [Sinorhizobium fredii USDA 205]MCG5476211.1 FAD-binding protein [Sinorhizobium fredii]MQW94629.1 FAD-binding protein [Sinorhizobium fredii]MQX11016.1 FAD-binding protein [Sinorhizobium fredii]